MNGEFDFVAFVMDEALILIPALMIIGKMIKSTKIIETRFIPVILLFLGVALAVGMLGASVENIVQGILISGAAVFSHQLFIQTKPEKKK